MDNIHSPKKIYQDTQKRLDKVSPSFCVAKWNQVTLHLSSGTNHSCHHPKVHQIPLVELKKSPSALHNTKYKKELRKEMLSGIRPTECDYCWRVEDANNDSKEKSGHSSKLIFSDRIIKSSDIWAKPYIEKISKTPWDENVTPRYVEVDFDTTCNFKCAYCGPSFSTTWAQEIKTYGPYITKTERFNEIDTSGGGNGLPILQSEYNPYIESFWEWWPSLVKDLHTFRITGGEPLLSKNTFKVLDFIIENPQPQLEFSINSNLGIPDEIFDKFIEKIKHIQLNKLVKSFKLYTSNEAHGAKAEYSRFGLNYEKWLGNVDKFLYEVPTSNITLMCTYNILSVTSFKDFLQDVLDLKIKYTKKDRATPLMVNIPYLRNPTFLVSWILTGNFLEYIEESISFMYRNMEITQWPPLCGKGFYGNEIHDLERVYYLMKDNMLLNNDEKSEKAKEIWDRRNAFTEYIEEYDRRRGTNFFDTFPELEGFFYFCKQPYKYTD
jgi:organic radical activating enzyme